jgi:thiol-disulfide isomerase/thioredoxin
MRSARLLSATIAALLFAAPALTRADDAERTAFYRACSDPDPGGRLRKMAGYLEAYPSGERSDRVRTILFGVVASGAWEEAKPPFDRTEVGAIVSREGDSYLRTQEDPDRVLLLCEAYLRSGTRISYAADLAARGASLAESGARPSDMPLSSWGRIKRERVARSNYLGGLAAAGLGDAAAAAELFRKAEPVFRNDPRFREEYARALSAAGLPRGEAPVVDQQAAALEAVGASGREERIAKFEEYLRRFPSGAHAVEIGIRLVEEHAKSPGGGAKAIGVAERTAAASEDPEVLSALALVLADAGVGTDRAVDYGARAVRILEAIIRSPSTQAADLPSVHAALLLVRDAYGWALLKSGRSREATDQLKMAAESEYPEVEYHYGSALVEAGKHFDAAGPLVNAYMGGVEEALEMIERVRAGSSALRSHVDDLLAREEEKLRRRKLAEEESGVMPDFSLVSLDGVVVSSREAAGRPLVLFFWATWCDPCRDLLPRLQRVRAEYERRGVRFLGINSDRDFWLVRPFLDELKINMETVVTAGEEDWEEKARAFRVGALPTVLLVDRGGRIRYADEGADPGGLLFEKILGWRLDRLLEE